MRRPLVAVVGRLTRYRFPFKYTEHPEYLAEDGDLIFALAAKIDKSLQGWNYVSGRAGKKTKNLLICQISKAGETKTIRLKVDIIEGDDNTDRIWVEKVEKPAKSDKKDK